MASLLHVGPQESRVPETEVLRDGRKRLTRFFEAGPGHAIPPQLNLAVGTADFFDTAPVGWTGLLLTDKKLTDELPSKPGADSRPIVQLIFEQISATLETQVGGRTERKLPDGRVGYELNYLQYSTNAFVPGTPGTDTDPNDASAFLLEVEGPDDGTLRQIKRTYVYAGELSTRTESKNNGNLSIITTSWAVTTPPTPGGYVLTDTPTQNPNGLPIRTYTFAKGNGLISTQLEFRQSPDQGTTGMTITTFRFLTAPSVNTDPTTPPASSVNIGHTSEEADGYRIWTSIYAAGAGIILSTVENKEGGKLVIYRQTSLNAIPAPPSATIGGTVMQISATKHSGSRFESGVWIYEYMWAEGLGLISQEDEWLQSPDQGTNGVSRRTIRFLVAIGGTVQPTSEAGYTAVRQAHEDSDGYTVWTTVWGKGAGLVVDEKTVMKVGALVTYHRVGLGSAPSPPSATIGGTLVAFESGTRNADGFVIYDYRWAEGNGQCKISSKGNAEGALFYEVVVAALSAGTPAYPGGGTAYLVGLDQDAMDGYFLNSATYHKPPASQTFNKTIDWDLPGQVEPTSPDPGYILVPGNERFRILAEVTVDYGTSQINDVPWTVENWSAISESYVIASNGQTVTRQWGLQGYLSNGFTFGGGTGTYNGIAVSSYSLTVLASSPGAPPSGLKTLHTNNDPYLVDLTGVVVYRRTKTAYTF